MLNTKSPIPLVLLVTAFASPCVSQTGAIQRDQNYRPGYHFSPHSDWTNDPNGLVFFQGEYHLFFQFNPFGDQWGHMSWGHAVSRNLLRWRQLPVALPEEKGIMIFTGSTVIDERNRSGFCLSNHPCLIAVYTGHTPAVGNKPALQTQNLAFSNDQGQTWTKYEHNPVLDLAMSDFRDPKVFWYEPAQRWTMAVSLPNEHKIRFYGSPDLRHWTMLSDFGPEGAITGQWECPELFEAGLDNTAEKRWVLKVGLNPGALQGGSGEQYFIGTFDGTTFRNQNPSSKPLWTDFGKDCYCALTFNGLPKGHAPIMIGWLDNWQYAATLPTNPWRGQMTVPRTVSLKSTSDGIRLVQTPVLNLDSNSGIERISMDFRSSKVIPTHSFRLRSEMETGTAQVIGWRLLADGTHYTAVGYERASQMLFVDRTHSGLVSFSKDFPAKLNAPLKLVGDNLKLDVLVDRDSVEVFADGGTVVSTNLIFPPARANTIKPFAEGGVGGRLTVEIQTISSK